MENKQSDFDKIAPTAWMVAYRRTFSDIPFSQEIFAKLEILRKKKDQKEIPADLKRPEIAPQFEARHKLIDKLIFAVGFDQVLELASGFSSRGLSMSKEDGFNYVETDLSRVILEKEQIIKEIARDNDFDIPSNLHFVAANVLEFEQLARAVDYFDKTKPITIINEGLLRYLTFAEKAKVAQNIYKLLTEFGGVWITSDVSLRKIFSQENIALKDHVKKVSELTGKDIEGNRFEKEEDAKLFFEKLGFSIERHSFIEVIDDLVSPSRLKLSESQVKDIIADAVVFVMRRRM